MDGWLIAAPEPHSECHVEENLIKSSPTESSLSCSKGNRELFRGLLRDEETEAQLVLWFEHAMVRFGSIWGCCGNPRRLDLIWKTVLEKKIPLPSPSPTFLAAIR